MNTVSIICLVLGFVSIFASLGLWFIRKGETPESKADAQRVSIFVGLWVPAFFALSIYFRIIAAGQEIPQLYIMHTCLKGREL